MIGKSLGTFDVVWSITRQCNMRCIYCRSRNQDSFSVPWKDVEECLCQLRDSIEHHVLLKITFTGGEPTMCQDIMTRLGPLRRRLPATLFEIHTNGMYLDTDEFRHQLLSTFSQILVSIDMPRVGEVTHNLRVGGDGSAVWRSLARLCEGKRATETRVGVVVTVHRSNRSSLASIVNDVGKLGADWISFQPLRAAEGDTFASQCLSAREVLEVHDELCASNNCGESSTRVDISMLGLASRNLSGKARTIPACHAGNRFIYITNEMRVFPCCMVWPNHPLGLSFDQALRLLKEKRLHKYYSELLRNAQLLSCLKCVYYNNMANGSSE